MAERDKKYGEIIFGEDTFLVLEKEECNDDKWYYVASMLGLDPDNTDRITFTGTVKYFGVEYENVTRITHDEFIHTFGQNIYNYLSRNLGCDLQFMHIIDYPAIVETYNVLQENNVSGIMKILDEVFKNKLIEYR